MPLSQLVLYSHVHTVYSDSELDLYMVYVIHVFILTVAVTHTHTHSLRVVTRDTLRFTPLQETVLDYLHC